MVVKGNLHADGRKLAAYLITGKKGERAELVELRGFASSDIHAAFIDVHIQAAEATQCAKPFFHSYIRLPENEELFRGQWKHVADRIEKQLGFEGQGRAIAFHHQPGGNTHMHIAWSRIDLEQRRARDPGLYKNKLKEISRQLECELGLTRISSERPAGRKTRAPGRKEFEQARRLGTGIAGIREAIRACWDSADNGRSFMAALAAHGLVLARGERRDFVIVDHAGGAARAVEADHRRNGGGDPYAFGRFRSGSIADHQSGENAAGRKPAARYPERRTYGTAFGRTSSAAKAWGRRQGQQQRDG